MARRPDPTLPEKLAFLREAAGYPEPTHSVQELETHMPWLFLTDRKVYELKKAYHRDGIDCRSAPKRRLACRREHRLNRRLAPHVYEGLSSLTLGVGGMTIDGKGRAIDWLVRMKRLPEHPTLEQRLLTRRGTRTTARELAERLHGFFRAARISGLSAKAYRRKLCTMVNSAAARIRRPAYRFPVGPVDKLARGLRRHIDAGGELLDARAKRVVEGHGDLRPEHVHLTHPSTIIDCIEFDRGLRLRDPVEELAFLALECERGEQPAFGHWLLEAYCSISGDAAPRSLVDFYRAYNALLRTHIAIWHLDDPATGPADHWRARALDYLAHGIEHLKRVGNRL